MVRRGVGAQTRTDLVRASSDDAGGAAAQQAGLRWLQCAVPLSRDEQRQLLQLTQPLLSQPDLIASKNRWPPLLQPCSTSTGDTGEEPRPLQLQLLLPRLRSLQREDSDASTE